MQNCLICGSSHLSILCSINKIPKAAQNFLDHIPTSHYVDDSTNLSVYQCSACTHVQQLNSIVDYHLDVITTSSLSPLILKKRDLIVDELSSQSPVKDPFILEVGAYRGQYIDHLLSLGYRNVHGIEHGHDSSGTSICPKQCLSKQHVHNLSKPFLTQHSSQYDILLCFNFLEHSVNPHLFMRGITSCLKDGAYVYFTLPSVEYIFREDLLQEFVPDHISYFTKRSLSTLFTLFGFSIVSLASINNDNDFELIAKYEPGTYYKLIDTTPFNTLVGRLNNIINTTSIHGHKIAFWGAGHRSLTLLSQLSYDRISFVVDSASFKQGLYTPVSHLPIISPGDLREFDIDILILSLPGIYNDEVANEIKGWHKKPSKIFSISANTLSECT